MRCSSCEPLLDPFLEGTLSRAERAAVSAHVGQCAECAELLHELRVVDALLTTARTHQVDAGFTESVVSAAAAAPPHVPRRLPFGLAILLYVGFAWVALAAALRVWPVRLQPSTSLGIMQRDANALGAAFHAIAPATPFAAAVVTIVLLVDFLLLGALLYAHRRMRPFIALVFQRERRS